MAICPIILDEIPDYLRAHASASSILLVPLGTGTLLSHLCDQAIELQADDVNVIPPRGVDEAYARRIEQASGGKARVLDPARLDDLIHNYEPADTLLVVDARYWPAEGFDLGGMVQRGRLTPYALHAVASRDDVDAAQEYVRTDDRGYVRMVRRYYDGVTWAETGAIPCSVLPVAAAEGVAFSSLAELRSCLAERGMLSQDLPVCSGIVDLSVERAMLAFSERMVVEAVEGPLPAGFGRWSKGVIIGRGCCIHTSARIVGPVVLQDDVTIDQDVTIIGPAVIGAGSRVNRGASVIQATLSANTVLHEGVAVRHSLISGECLQCPLKAIQVHWDPTSHSSQFAAPDASDLHATDDLHSGTSLSRKLYHATKLTIDTIVAAAGLLVLSPVVLILSILVRLDSPGPILFGHEREGKDGRVFKCWKFRTMVADAHKKQRELYKTNKCDGPQFKLDHDPRITRVGKWLRATNLDEIPQLINVLKGEMSVVGPRPSPFRENQICIPWRRARLSVRPGITGLWQVCRHDRESGDFHQWIAYDMKYVAHSSLMVDFRIVLATILTLGGQRSIPEHWIIGKHGPARPLSRRGGRAATA